MKKGPDDACALSGPSPFFWALPGDLDPLPVSAGLRRRGVVSLHLLAAQVLDRLDELSREDAQFPVVENGFRRHLAFPARNVIAGEVLALAVDDEDVIPDARLPPELTGTRVFHFGEPKCLLPKRQGEIGR